MPKRGPRSTTVPPSSNPPSKSWTSFIVPAPTSVFFPKWATARPCTVWRAENVGRTRFEIRLPLTPCTDSSPTSSAISVHHYRRRITTMKHACTSLPSTATALRSYVRCSTLTPSTGYPKCGIHAGTSFRSVCVHPHARVTDVNVFFSIQSHTLRGRQGRIPPLVQ